MVQFGGTYLGFAWCDRDNCFARVERAAARDGLDMECSNVVDCAGGGTGGLVHRDMALSDWADTVDDLVQNWAWSLQGKVCDFGYPLPLSNTHMLRILVLQVLAMQASLPYPTPGLKP